MPRLELNLDTDILQALQIKADAARQSRKRYIELLVIKAAQVDTEPSEGQYIKTKTGYKYNYNGETLFTQTDTIFLDNFQYQFTGDHGSIEDSLTF